MTREPLRILLIEDNPGDARLLEVTLSEVLGSNMSMEVEESLSAGMKRLQKEAFSIILLDLGLPDCQGLDTLEAILGTDGRTPVVVLTGYDDEETGARAVQMGAQDYVIKGQVSGELLGRMLRHAIERKERSEKQEILRRILEELNRQSAGTESLSKVLDVIKEFARFEAAGLRLREGADYPYYTTAGFSDGFVEMERTLCTLDQNGRVALDDRGNAYLECMCGNVLCGRIDLEQPFFSKHGSFWTNCTTKLLAEASQGSLQTRTRNRCSEEGYETVVLVPLRSGTETVGLLQLNDRRPDRLTPDLLSTLEEIGSSLGIGIGRILAQQELRQKEEQLRQSQKMEAIGSLAGGMAHDFNNLLGVITGYSGLMLSDLSKADPLRENVEEIKLAAERAAQLTSRLLAFSRKQVLELKVLDLNEQVTGMEKMLRRLLGEDLDLLFVPEPALGRVRADSGQIEQILMNLAVNAREAMPKGGKLTIETANVQMHEDSVEEYMGIEPGSYVLLAVSDTGTGMSPEVRERVFEPFFTTKPKGKGTGLGLATIYGIVKQSHGDIRVYSEPGKGTTFKVYLPVVEGEVAAARGEEPTQDRIHGTETILVVEDEAVLLRVISRILTRSGYDVLEASNAGEAILASEKHGSSIDMMLTDVVMPQMSGVELGERLHAAYPALKVLYMSGYTDNAIVHHEVLDEGVMFIQKPFSANKITLKVREVLDRTP